jgi:2-haloacid dehalogenase
MTPKALIFDVFGTLMDWRSSVARDVAAEAARKGLAIDAEAFATTWRAEYDPAMKRIRDGGRGYVALDVLHRENLDRVLTAFSLDDAFDETERTALNHAWERLDPWPDVVSGLSQLKAHAIIAPCSNGSIALMTRLAKYARLPWDCILGADIARDYKPKPEVYLASCAALRLDPGKVMMVAAHNSDLHAARSAGLLTGFIPRPTEHGPDQTTDLVADSDWDIVAADLNDLANRLA